MPTFPSAFRLQGPSPVLRRVALFGAAIALTLWASMQMADVLGADSFTKFELTIVVLFTINFFWIALSFATAVAGLLLRLFNRDPITLKRAQPRPLPRELASRNVVVVPVYNESPHAVFARLRAMVESVRSLGFASSFDFFILSDTRDPDIWIAEELTWGTLRRSLRGPSKIFYRRRALNTDKKSGNLMAFCENWGAAYDHMIVLDADSLMTGEALVQMAALMEANPDTGLIQAPPQPMGQHTLFARILQFISAVHGPTMTAGLAFWQMSSGNYWGHNAILRMSAFMACCGLPVLPGRPPLGGSILSHDFVEAALLRRAGWRVWLVPDIAGSWEELPSNVMDYAARDRRWCQGNLQHIRLVFAERIKPLSRLHLFMGVMAFLSSPLWFLLLLASTLTAWDAAQTAHPFFGRGPALFPAWPIDRAQDMLLLLGVTLGMLIVPKFLSAFFLMARAATARLYGGRVGLMMSALIELLFSVVLAPAMMLLHSSFVVGILLGRGVAWEAQNRTARGIAWSTALRFHLRHALIGLVWGGVAYVFAPTFFWWMTPVLAGMVLAPVLSVLGSRESWGAAARRLNLFLTPEEVQPPAEIVQAGALMALPAPDTSRGLLAILEDPQASALHAALIPEAAPDERTQIEVGLLYEKLARLGLESLTREEKIKLLSFPVKPLDQIAAGRAGPA